MNEIPESPTRRWLTGEYKTLINKKKEKVKRFFPENSFMLTCKSCGRKGKYDVGLMTINQKTDESDEVSMTPIQTTGYFRCKHCNDAGNWEMPTDFYTAAMAQVLMGSLAPSEEGKKAVVGKQLLHDGSWHLFASDAEMHLLQQLRGADDVAFVWNRLGNLYHKGGRPEIAASAFEHSIMIDPKQVESHFSLGTLLYEVEEHEKSANHFRQALLAASDYEKMPAEELRQLLAAALQNLLWQNHQSDGEIPFSPTQEEMNAAGRAYENETTTIEFDMELIPVELESFYPFAEMYMGPLRKRIPKRLRTFDMNIPAKKKKKKKRKKRSRKK